MKFPVAVRATHMFSMQLRAFHASTSGLAALEFALILPLLLTLFFGVVEGSDALSKSRKVALAVNTLADLTAQETEILASEADDLFDGIEQIIGNGGDSATIRLLSVVLNEDDDIVVHWSRDNSGAEPYTPGSAYNDLPNNALLDPNASIVVAEIEFAYTSNLTHLFVSSINFDRQSTRWPRRSTRVQLCTSPGNCTS
ncbi:MAG: TadE/TadG family type IV pilus assembly protein [Pseudomonadota bacterium]